MRDRFITTNNLKEHVSDAMSVYVASGYLSKSAIDDLRAVLKQLPNNGGRMFRFLLDKEFCPEPQLRPALVNMLLELPNAEVRIYAGVDLFHPKLYIFENGNRMCTTIGSFNMTGGGAGRNIEAGVELHNRELHREAKRFFDTYWNHPDTIVARYDESAVFVARRYQPGDEVTVLATGTVGVVLGEPPALVGSPPEWAYTVNVCGERQILRESELEGARVTVYSSESRNQHASSDVREWFKNYILEKEGDQADNVIGCYATTRTALFPYQFRPLFKILQAETPRLLIADEVGLGKTIEAGMILKELAIRQEMRRVLVIVPNSLKTKWRDELQVRFDEYFDILSAGDLASFLNDHAVAPGSARIHGIITYDQLVVRSLRERIAKTPDTPPFDLVIVDEAHWLKNRDTIRFQVVDKLVRKANALVMLTATPIQLGTSDLFNLLTILVPDVCVNLDDIGFSASLTVNERINRTIAYLKNRDFVKAHAVIAELQSKRTFQKSLERLDDYEAILTRAKACTDSTSAADLVQVASELYGLNVLSHYVNRTLRRDVADKFADRQVRTWEYEYTPEEIALYEAIVEACRREYSAKKHGVFATITPERRAASSLPALCLSVRSNTADAQEYLDGIDSEEDTPTGSDTADGVFRAIRPVVCGAPILQVDSKLQQLEEIVRHVLAASSSIADQKLMVFCVFKATIQYLAERLGEHFPSVRVETLTGDDDSDTRDRKRSAFENSDSPAILLCSEVAGEGLDFQFCHFLVNYDMPWNPSKLEQRAGRIDRMGQEADIVTIFNLVNRRTIEDHVMAKLFERVKIFSDAIGPLGNILGGVEKNLAVHMLSPARDAEAQQKYEDQVLANAENKMREQARLEEGRVELFGVAEYFYDETLKARQHFYPSEIRLLWELYLAGTAEVSVGGDAIGRLPITDSVQALVLGAINKGCEGHCAEKKKRHYTSVIRSHKTNSQDLLYTFDQQRALDNLRLQFLNIAHPLIQGAIQSLRSGYRPNRATLSCRCSTVAVPKGEYLLFTYRFRIVDHTSASVRSTEDATYLFDVAAHDGVWGSHDALLSDLIGSCGSPATAERGNSLVQELEPVLRETIMSKAERILADTGRVLSMTANKRIVAATRQYEKRVMSVKRDLARVHDQRMREAREREIETIRQDFEKQTAALKAHDLRVTTKCTGVIHFINEEAV